MNKKIPHALAVSFLALVLGACGTSESQEAATQSAATAAKKAPKKTDAPAANTPAVSATVLDGSGQASTGFIDTLPVGFVIRATCEMGSCDWLRVTKVERAGIDAEPKFNFDFQRGESTHASDYPPDARGVQINWTTERPKGVVLCSREHPYASIGGQGDDLKLSPAGVGGALQTPANTYFAACHGESGDDAKLAEKYGYNLK